MSLDLKRLRSAVAVAEEGNLSRAAARLHLSQPALSRRIQELEKYLQFSLFEHVGRGIRLTGEGQVFLNQCRDLLAHAEAVEDHARSFASGDSGVLRIGASPQVLEHLFPELLPRYGALFPLVEVELVEDNQSDLLLRLERGEIHLAMSALPTSGRVESRVLAPALVLAAIAHTHPLNGVQHLELDELGDSPVLATHEGFKSRQIFDAACRLAHVEPHIVLESGTPQTILALAEAGLGIAIFPSTVRVERRGLHVMPLVHDGALLEMQFAISWTRGRYLAPYAIQFIEEMVGVAREKLAPKIAAQ